MAATTVPRMIDDTPAMKNNARVSLNPCR